MTLAIFTLLGAFIGLIGSVLTVFIQQRYQTKRERIKNIVDLGFKEYASHLQVALKKNRPIPPLAAYLIYNSKIIEALLNKPPIDKKKVEEITKEFQDIVKAFPGAPEDEERSQQ